MPTDQLNMTVCPIASAVAADVRTRAEKGLAKYGVTLARTDLSQQDWLQHLYEQLLDAVCYVKRLIEMKAG